MFKSITKLTKDVGLLTVALTLALVANFAYGQWAEPTGTPPTNNTPAPVNVGTSNQVKNGGLSVNALSVIGNSLYNGSYIDFLFNTDSKWRMQRNDGFGNWHTYLNTEGGTSPTHFGSGFALRQTYNTGDGIYQFKSSGATGAAGDAVTWQDTMNIYPDGRVGASQFCDVDGNNCLDETVNDNVTILHEESLSTGGDIINAHLECIAAGHDGVWGMSENVAGPERVLCYENSSIIFNQSGLWFAVNHRHDGRTNYYVVNVDIPKNELYAYAQESCNAFGGDPSGAVSAVHYRTSYNSDGQRSGLIRSSTGAPNPGAYSQVRALSAMAVGDTITVAASTGGCSGGATFDIKLLAE